MDMLTHLDGQTMPNPTAMIQGQGATAPLGWLPAAIVIIIGLIKSSDGPNRFGEAPIRF